MKHTIAHIITALSKQFAPLYEHEDERVQVALWMLEELAHKSAVQLFAAGTIDLDEAQEHKLKHWVHQHAQEHKPLQYIFGYVPFGPLTLLVEPPVLIPRPETEEWIMNLCAQLTPLAHEALAILDIGAGSGALALSLAQALPKAHVIAIDITQHALALSKKNAAHNGITNVEFIHSDLFEHIGNKKFDLIVSNPPYIAPEDEESLDVMVSQWEDRQALIAPEHGLEIIKKIIKQAPPHIQHNQAIKKIIGANLFIEIGYDQGESVMKQLKTTSVSNPRIIKDLTGKDRVACAYI